MKTIRVLAVGDVVGSRGCELLRQRLPVLKKHYAIDAVIVNGENSADGNGITPRSAEHIFQSGADVITTGNHTFRRREVYEELDTSPFLLRPGNYPDSAPGRGWCLLDRGAYRVAVLNLQGVVYMENLRCPFEEADRMVREAKEAGAEAVFVDFHAEATSEKKAMGFYLDGRVTALFGTHTHVQTADERILSRGTGYLTDLGMTGCEQESVLGVRADCIIDFLRTKMPCRFLPAEGPVSLHGALFSIDPETAKVTSVRRIAKTE